MMEQSGGNGQWRKPNVVGTRHKKTVVQKKHCHYPIGDDTSRKKETERARVALNIFRVSVHFVFNLFCGSCSVRWCSSTSNLNLDDTMFYFVITMQGEKRLQHFHSETFKLQRKRAYELAKEARTANTRNQKKNNRKPEAKDSYSVALSRSVSVLPSHHRLLQTGEPHIARPSYTFHKVHAGEKDRVVKKSSLSNRSIYSNAGARYFNGVGMETISRDLVGRHAGGSSSHSHSKKKRPWGQLRSSSAHVSSAEPGRGHRVEEEQKELRHVIQSIISSVSCATNHSH